jgi:hypothetical protein
VLHLGGVKVRVAARHIVHNHTNIVGDVEVVPVTCATQRRPPLNC